MRPRFSSAFLLLALAACHRRPRETAPPPPPALPPTAAPSAPEAEASAPVDDLVPGALNAFGLTMPTVTQERMVATDMKIFRVDASMPRVMRYLEHRLEVHDADIHPLAAVIHRAIVKDVQLNLIVDVGVRDEGDRTMVTVWNRTPPPAAGTTPRTLDDGLRAVGVDPATGQYAPEQNR